LTPIPWVVIIFLALAAWGGVHSLLASHRAKDLARRWFGSLADRGYRLGYNLFSGLSFLPVLALAAILPDRLLYIIPFPWFLLTTSIQAGAVLAVLAGLRQTGLSSFLGLSQLLATQSESQSPMIVEGLYHWVRHPLYTAGFVFIWSFPVMTLNLLALNIGMSAYLVIGAYFEERRLVREYGEQYMVYRRQTPMLIPRLTKKKSIVMDREG
jgi:protein-S-isoprenylcysteine O-methyltransferase Ste14